MKKPLLVAIFLAALLPLRIWAWPGTPPFSSGHTNYDPATTAWVSAVVAAGGTVSATEERYVNTLIVSLKTQYSTNYFTSCDHLWLLASASTKQANVDIIGLSSLTPNNAPTFTPFGGYTGNASNMYLDTGVSGVGRNFTQNSASALVYVITSRTGGDSYSEIGAVDATPNQISFYPNINSSTMTFYLNDNTGEAPSAPANIQGFWLMTRTGATADALYKNSSSTAYFTGTTTSTAVPSDDIFILGINLDGAIYEPTSDQIGLVGLCGGFTATQSSQIQGILNAYMISVGANVY